MNHELTREEWVAVLDALEYAADDKEYEAIYTSDAEDKAALTARAEQWRGLTHKVARFVGWT